MIDLSKPDFMYNTSFKFAQFDIPFRSTMTDPVAPETVAAAIDILECDPWEGKVPTFEDFLQAFFINTWRIASAVSITTSKSIRYLMVKQIVTIS